MASTSLSIQRQREILILDGLARLRKKTCRKGTRLEQVKPYQKDITIRDRRHKSSFRNHFGGHRMHFPRHIVKKLHNPWPVLGQRTGPTTNQINAMNTMDRERIRGRIRPRPVWGGNVGWDPDSPEPAREMRRSNCPVNGLSRRGSVPVVGAVAPLLHRLGRTPPPAAPNAGMRQ